MARRVQTHHAEMNKVTAGGEPGYGTTPTSCQAGGPSNYPPYYNRPPISKPTGIRTVELLRAQEFAPRAQARDADARACGDQTGTARMIAVVGMRMPRIE